MIEKHQLDDDVEVLDHDQVAWSLKAQAAIIRTVQAKANGREPAAADMQTIDQVRAGLAEVDRVTGREQPKQPPAAPSVDLDKLEKLIGEYQTSFDPEALKAFLAEQRKAKAETPKTETPPAKPLPAPAATPQPRPTAERTEQPNADQEMYRSRTRAEVAKRGVKAENLKGWFVSNVVPLIEKSLRKDFPDQKPDVVYPKLSAQARYQLAKEAMEEWDRSQTTKPKSPPTVPGERPMRTTGGGSPGGATGSAVDAFINAHARD